MNHEAIYGTRYQLLSDGCKLFVLLLYFAVLIRSPVPVSLRVCMIDYLIEMASIYICASLCFYHAKFHVPDYYYHVKYCKTA